MSAPFLRLGAYVEWRQRELYRLSLRTLNKLKVVADGVELGAAVFKALLAIEVSGSFKRALAGMPYAALWNLVARTELGVPPGETPGYFNVARTHEGAAAKVAV